MKYIKLLIICLVLSVNCYSQALKKDSLSYAYALSDAFEDVANIITPSLVSISASFKPEKEELVKKKKREMPQGDDLSQFFGEDFVEKFLGPNQGQKQDIPKYGSGTGFILDNKGHILTNHHVIKGANEIKVGLGDKEYKAEVIGEDPRTDLAVIKIISKVKLTPVRLGDSEKLRIGEWVVAAGSPFGLDNTITAGIVSAKGRSIMQGSQYEDFIQTDAAINPGNSGGPLINLKGEVVGINTAIFSRSGGYMGIGFAIPVNMAKNIFESLIKDGTVVRGWLGVTIQDLNFDLASSFGYESIRGSLVGDVSVDSPAEKSGFKSADIIIEFNGVKIKDSNHLRNVVAATSPESKVDVKVFRNKKVKTLKVQLGVLDLEKLEKATSSEGDVQVEEDFEKEIPELDAYVKPLDKELMSSHKLNNIDEAVVISNLEKYGIGADSGLRIGNVISSVNGQSFKGVNGFSKLMKKVNMKDGVRLVILVKGGKRFLFIKED